jgi:hypothetical protein
VLDGVLFYSFGIMLEVAGTDSKHDSSLKETDFGRVSRNTVQHGILEPKGIASQTVFFASENAVPNGRSRENAVPHTANESFHDYSGLVNHLPPFA